MQNSNKIRWWPLVAIIALGGSFVALLWLKDTVNRQALIQNTAITIAVSVLLGLIWLLFFSRIARHTRIKIFFGLIVLLALPAVLLRIRGFSGDLLPVVEWRWQSKPAEPPNLNDRLEPDARSIDSNAEGWRTADDYTQFLGNNRRAVISHLQLERDWNRFPPALKWKIPIGAGWSAFAVKGQYAVTQEQLDEHEAVSCHHLETGALIWRHRYPARYESAVAGNGPRATPTIFRQRVYTVGATGVLTCLDLATGDVHWSKDIFAENNGRQPTWGMSASPLLLDSLVIVPTSSEENSLAAYRIDDGTAVWKNGQASIGHSSPMIATLNDRRQIVMFNAGSLAGHDLATGAVLWQHAWPRETQSVAQPLVLNGNRVFASSGYGIGCKMFQVESRNGEFEVAMLWESPRLKSKFANMVFHRGHIFGLDDGVLVCLDPSNGKRKWKRGRYGHGQLILVDDLLLIQAENGEVVLVEADPEQHRELTKFPALDSKTWNCPALAGSHLLVRNDCEAACYELAVR